MTRSREEAIRLGIRVCPVNYKRMRRKTWHDYHEPGTYMITVHVVEDESGYIADSMVLSEIEGDCFAPSASERFPHPRYTDLGVLVNAKIRQIPYYNNFRDVGVISSVVMPTHVHLLLRVKRKLPFDEKRNRQISLGDMVRGFKQGCTSMYKRLMDGESVSELLKECTIDPNGERTKPYTTIAKGKSDVTLWEENYNDRVVVGYEMLKREEKYVRLNAYYWKLQIDYPSLFEHRLHIVLNGEDYSSYGCLFLLDRGERRQVKCSRAARKGWLTSEEWERVAGRINSARTPDERWKFIREYEHRARELRLGGFDRNWVTTRDSEAIVPLPYVETEMFKRQKAELLQACKDDGAVLFSPAISPGEKDIFYAALDAGYPCVKLSDKPFDKKGHANNTDRDYCANGLLCVLGPWEIRDHGGYVAPVGTRYNRFHNLNAMTEDLCKAGVKMVMKAGSLMKEGDGQ